MGKKRMAVLRFDMPFAADPPQLTSAELGLPRIVRRATASYTMDTTLLDAADARLLRAGVIVAHRVVGGYGDWYFAAPDWAPHLPAERVEPLQASGDLPDGFASLIRPLARRAPIGAIAGLRVERDEWSLRNAEGGIAVSLLDERVTMRRSGVITTRYREVTLTPKAGLNRDQREFLTAALGVHGTQVEVFPSLQRRFGAPATGLNGFPTPTRFTRETTLEEYVTANLARHLRRIVETDLDRRRAVEDGVDIGIGCVNDRLWAFRRDLRGLAAFLDPQWRESIERRLGGLPFEAPAQLDEAVLGVVDSLVGAVYAPPLGDESIKLAGQAFLGRVEQATAILLERCQVLTVASGDEQWAGALRAAQQLGVLVSVAEEALPKGVVKLAHWLDTTIAILTKAALPSPPEPDLAGLSPQQAFRLGEQAQRRREELRHHRAEFTADWPRRAAKVEVLLKKAKKK